MQDYSLPHSPLGSALDAQLYSPPSDQGLDLVFQDNTLIVVTKPSGLLSVPGRGPEKADCMASRVQARFPDALIVHRLDMETSGLLVLARGAQMHRELSILFLQRKVEKRYVAIVEGHIQQDAGTVALPLITDWPNRPRQKVDLEIGKPSTTHFTVTHRDAFTNTSRVALEPVTGRSHQLRVHMQSLGHPILGDALYGSEAGRHKAARLQLHAEYIAFAHPATGQALELTSPAPF